jgi:pyruvate, water dikinase
VLLEFDQLEDQAVRTEINRVTAGYKDKSEFFVDKLAQGVAMIGRHSTRRT